MVVCSIKNKIHITVHILAFLFRFKLCSIYPRFICKLIHFIRIIIARAVIIFLTGNQSCDKYYSKNQFFHRKYKANKNFTKDAEKSEKTHICFTKFVSGYKRLVDSLNVIV